MDIIESKVKVLRFTDVSDAVKKCTKIGLRVDDYQQMMKDPKRADEFQKKMQEFIRGEEVFEWTDTLDYSQLDGFLMALQMRKDERYKQLKFI